MTAPNGNKYKNFVVETRPRLQSVNVIVNLEEPVHESGTCKVDYDGTQFLVAVGGVRFRIPFANDFVVPETMSGVNVDEKFISFKCFTRNKALGGAFSTEVLQIPTKLNIDPHQFEIGIKKNLGYTLQCSACKAVLTKEIYFNKILPLPSDNLDVSSWFCHDHDTNSKTSLDPAENDLFYIPRSYIHLNPDSFTNIKWSNATFSCGSCSGWLGAVPSPRCFRTWSNTVSFVCAEQRYGTDPLRDCYSVIRSLLDDDSTFGVSRAILHCRGSGLDGDHLLLWVFERRLDVAFGNWGEDCHKKFVCKVLFKFGDGSDDAVRQWSGDATTSTVEVSKCMVVALRDLLYGMRDLLPAVYAVSNGFNVSYIPLYSD